MTVADFKSRPCRFPICTLLTCSCGYRGEEPEEGVNLGGGGETKEATQPNLKISGLSSRVSFHGPNSAFEIITLTPGCQREAGVFYNQLRKIDLFHKSTGKFTLFHKSMRISITLCNACLEHMIWDWIQSNLKRRVSNGR
jgi:hypothetical protein